MKSKKDYKIILCNPPFYRFINFPIVYQNLGLGYLAANLIQNGYENVKIYQFDAPDTVERVQEDFQKYDPNWGTEFYINYINPEHEIWQGIKNVLIKEKPDFLGITTMSPQAEGARILAKIMKEINPHTKVIQGGIHASLFYSEVLEKSVVDVCALTEFDLAIAPLIDAIIENKDLSDFPGIGFKNEKGEIVTGPPKIPVHDLDEIPFPVRKIHTIGHKPTAPAVMPMVSSRGCPYNCTFCARLSMSGRKVRFRSAKNVVDEMEILYREYGARVFIFEDDTFTINRKRLKEIFSLIKERKLDISWECQTKVNVVDEELIKEMKEHGCTTISIGAESGNQDILDYINKRQTVEQIKEASKIIQDSGIILRPFFMIGYPVETEKTLQDTFNIIKELDSYTAHVYPIIPMPGSQIYQEVKKQGKISEERWFFYFFWNVNIFTRDFLSSKYVYDKFIEIRKFVEKRRRMRLKKLSRRPSYIVRKIFENFHSPRQLYYLFKRFIKLQFGKQR